MAKKLWMLSVTLLAGVLVILTACQRYTAQSQKDELKLTSFTLPRDKMLHIKQSDTPKPGTKEPATPVPSIPVEDLMEYDWIVRTPGVCEQVFEFEGGIRYTAQFSLVAMKFGGYTGSSLPVYNDGNHNPYVGYVSFSIKQKMKDVTDQIGIEELQGEGGISFDAFNSGARFYIDSPADDGTRAIISIETLATSMVDPTIYDYHHGVIVGGDLFSGTLTMPLDIRIEPAAGGYQLVVLNMKPGGGDIRFPAMLEKFPLSDIDKAERERIKKEQDEEARRKARELLEKVLEDWKKELRQKLENDSDDPTREGDVSSEDIRPVIPEDGGSTDDDVTIWPLVPESDGSTDDDVTLAPLTGGGTSEEVDFFPDSK